MIFQKRTLPFLLIIYNTIKYKIYFEKIVKNRKKDPLKNNKEKSNVSQNSFENDEFYRIPLNYSYDEVYGFSYKPEEDENTSDK